MGMGDFRAAERKSNSYSKPNSTQTKSNSQPKKSSVTQNNNASTKSTGTSGVQLTKSGGATASTRPMGMGDLKKAESTTNKSSTTRSSSTSQPPQGMGDLKVAESKANRNNTARASQGMGDLKVIESKNSNSNKSQLAKSVISTGVDFVPVVGNIKSSIEAVTGKDYITGEKLSNSARVIAVVGMVAGGVGKGVIKGASKVAGEVIEEVGKKVAPKVGNEIVQGTKKLIKETGKVKGSLNGLSDAEKKVVSDLVASGKNVEIIPKDPAAKVKSPDFKVDGVTTELKTLENLNTNTGTKRIKEAIKQGAEVVIIDGRSAGLSKNQAQEIINRAAGRYENKKIPAKVEIWTTNGKITN